MELLSWVFFCASLCETASGVLVPPALNQPDLRGWAVPSLSVSVFVAPSVAQTFSSHPYHQCYIWVSLYLLAARYHAIHIT